MRSLFVFATLSVVTGMMAAATGPAVEKVQDGETPTMVQPAPSPALAPAAEAARQGVAATVEEQVEREPEAEAEAEAEAEGGVAAKQDARTLHVEWDGAFGDALWISGEYDVVGCYCWLVQEGGVSATMHGALEPGTWSGGVELTWDATAHPTLRTLTLQVGTYRECMECGGAVQSYKVPGTSPLRVHLPPSSPDADHFWISVGQTETGRQHIATTMPFHVSGLIAPQAAHATP